MLESKRIQLLWKQKDFVFLNKTHFEWQWIRSDRQTDRPFCKNHFSWLRGPQNGFFRRKTQNFLKITIFPLTITVFSLTITIFYLTITIFPLTITIFSLTITIFPLMITIFPLTITIFPLMITIFPLTITIFSFRNTLFSLTVLE